jgi:hypothetical protein
LRSAAFKEVNASVRQASRSLVLVVDGQFEDGLAGVVEELDADRMQASLHTHNPAQLLERMVVVVVDEQPVVEKEFGTVI